MSRLTLLPGVDTEIEMRIFTDNVMSEVFWMGGRVALTMRSVRRHTPKLASSCLLAEMTGANAAIVATKLSARRVGPIYVTPEEVHNAPRVDAILQLHCS
jgi:hypothetical protein